MFDASQVGIVAVKYEDQMLEVYNCIIRDNMINGVQLKADFSISDFKNYILSYNIIFYNVYYENKLIGYIVIDVRTQATIEFNWGVCHKHRYITKMIEFCFDWVKSIGFINIIGTINPKNKLSLKVAERSGFTPCYSMKNYYGQGEDALIVKYICEGKNGE